MKIRDDRDVEGVEKSMMRYVLYFSLEFFPTIILSAVAYVRVKQFAAFKHIQEDICDA